MKKFHRLLAILSLALPEIACSSERVSELAIANEPPHGAANAEARSNQRVITSEPRNLTNEQRNGLAAVTSAKKEASIVKGSGEEGVANLPYSQDKVFRSLDDYLAHLEKLGAIDLPWWRQIRPGVYERVVHMRGAAREVKTREQLARMYGFDG